MWWDSTDGTAADCGVGGPSKGWFFQRIIEIFFFVDLTRSYVFKSSWCHTEAYHNWYSIYRRLLIRSHDNILPHEVPSTENIAYVHKCVMMIEISFFTACIAFLLYLMVEMENNSAGAKEKIKKERQNVVQRLCVHTVNEQTNKH